MYASAAQLAYYLPFAPLDTFLETLVAAAGRRQAIEESVAAAKGEVGLGPPLRGAPLPRLVPPHCAGAGLLGGGLLTTAHCQAQRGRWWRNWPPTAP
jgi:hypothetical protein